MIRKLLTRPAALAIACAVMSGCFLVGSPPADEVAELAVSGGMREQPDGEERPRGGERVLIIALDGVGDDELRDTLRAGGMPRLARALGSEADAAAGLYAHAWAVPGALTILPSTTMAAWSSVYTGEPVAVHGVSGNEWFERESMTFRAPAPISVSGSADSLAMVNDGLVGEALRAPTLFERVRGRSHVSMAPIYRGADLYTIPNPAGVTNLFTSFVQAVTSDESIEQETYREIDQDSVEGVLAGFDEHGVPDLQVLYFPGVDLYTHVAERPLEAEREYLADVVDPAIGEVLDAYGDRGLFETTWIVVVADHGHTPVIEDDRHSLYVDGDDEPTQVLARAGFRVRPPDLETDDDSYQAVVAYQGAIAYVYLADRSTCRGEDQRCDWSRPPRFEEDVMRVARFFRRASETGAFVPELRGTLDLVLAREPVPVGEDAKPFEVFDGERLVPIGEWLERSGRQDLVRFEERMRALSAGPMGHRAGDVLLLAKSGMHRPIEERFYFSGPYRSWHGSASAQDGEIPLIVARASASGRDIRRIVHPITGEAPSQLHVVPIVERLMKQ